MKNNDSFNQHNMLISKFFYIMFQYFFHLEHAVNHPDTNSAKFMQFHLDVVSQNKIFKQKEPQHAQSFTLYTST